MQDAQEEYQDRIDGLQNELEELQAQLRNRQNDSTIVTPVVDFKPPAETAEKETQTQNLNESQS